MVMVLKHGRGVEAKARDDGNYVWRRYCYKQSDKQEFGKIIVKYGVTRPTLDENHDESSSNH